MEKCPPSAEYAPENYRSPGYPGVPLEKALYYLRQLYAAVGDKEVEVTALNTIWEMKLSTSAACIASASLQKYGWLRKNGKHVRSVRCITPRGKQILCTEDGSAEWSEKIKEAFNSVPIFRNLSLEDTNDYTFLTEVLRVKYKYSQTGAQTCARVFLENKRILKEEQKEPPLTANPQKTTPQNRGLYPGEAGFFEFRDELFLQVKKDLELEFLQQALNELNRRLVLLRKNREEFNTKPLTPDH